MSPGAEERDDAALLRAVARGDEESLAVLYDRHAGWLTVRMARRCAMPDAVDHAVQDTFLALWRGTGAFPRGGGGGAVLLGGRPRPPVRPHPPGDGPPPAAPRGAAGAPGGGLAPG